MGWNPFNLRVLGVWPNPKGSKTNERFSNFCFFVAGFFMIGFICAPQSANLVFIWGNVDLMTENLAIANITVLTSFVKLLFLWYHKEALRLLMVCLVNDWKGCKTKEERSSMLEYGFLARKISIGCTLLMQATVVAFLISRISAVLQLDKNVTSPDRFSLYPAYFPYDVRESPAFELTILGQIISAFYTATCATVSDTFVCMLVLHNCGQLVNLQRTVENAFEEGNSKEKGKFHKILMAIVERHEHLNWFGKTIEKCFNIQLLGQILACTVQLCFQGFQAFSIFAHDESAVSTFQVLFLVFYISFVMVHLYIYCYVGETLIVQSSGLGYSAYCSEWYNAPPQEAKTFLLIGYRSTMPLRLRAGKFSTFSLEMFSNILKTSMGYLSVLLTVSKH